MYKNYTTTCSILNRADILLIMVGRPICGTPILNSNYGLSIIVMEEFPEKRFILRFNILR